MKVILDNIIFSLQKAGGISVYWSELAKRFKNTENIRFLEHANDNIFRNTISIKTDQECKLPIKILRYLPFMRKLPKNGIFHSSYYRVSLQKNIKNITTVHDFTYEYFREGLAKYIHIWQKGFAIKRSNGIICVSENTKKDLMKFYPMVEESKIKVIYNGVSHEFKKLENAKELLANNFRILEDKKYILYVGDRSGYKNFQIALDILKLKEDFNLVVVGGKSLTKDELVSMKSVKGKVLHLRGVNNEKLNILYNNALCLLYPSSYEGFGIPVVEAMKAGCPVVGTNKSSIPEVTGDAGLLVEQINVVKFIVQIERLMNADFRTDLINKGFKQANKFSWNKCFDETYNFYQKCLGDQTEL